MTLTCPSLRPGRNALPYRCTLTSGNRAARWCTRSSIPIAGTAVVAVGDGRPAEHVAHHGERRDRVGATERVVQHRPQVLLELAGHRPVHRPVAGVVRAHGQLVDDQPVRRRRRRRRPGTARPPAPRRHPGRAATRRANRLAAAAMSSSRPGAGAITSTQMPSCCTVCTMGQAAAWPNGDRATSAASSRCSGTKDSTTSRAGTGQVGGQRWQIVAASRSPRRRGRRSRRGRS